MITKILIQDENNITIHYDNRPNVIIATDDGSAWNLAEWVTNGYYHLTYTEYQGILKCMDDMTEEIAA